MASLLCSAVPCRAMLCLPKTIFLRLLRVHFAFQMSMTILQSFRIVLYSDATGVRTYTVGLCKKQIPSLQAWACANAGM